MNRSPLSSVSYWNQFLRYSEEHNIPLNHEQIEQDLAEYKGQDFVPFDLFKDLVNEIWSASKEPWLGLDFAEKIQLSSHGSLGFAISHGVDLQECLNLITRYYQTRLQAVRVEGSMSANLYSLNLEETCDWKPIRVLLYEVMLSSLIQVIEFVIGKDVARCKIHFPYAAPEWERVYQEKMPCAYSFNHNTASIQIPAELLSIKSISPNKQTLTLATNQCDLEMARLRESDTTKAKVIELVESCGHFKLTAEEAADKLHLSKSTLARRLKTENTSFSEVITELRKEKARILLISTSDSIESIALSLDYEDSSNFNRSFKRWFHCSPSEFRAENALKLVKK